MHIKFLNKQQRTVLMKYFQISLIKLFRKTNTTEYHII